MQHRHFHIWPSGGATKRHCKGHAIRNNRFKAPKGNQWNRWTPTIGQLCNCTPGPRYGPCSGPHRDIWSKPRMPNLNPTRKGSVKIYKMVSCWGNHPTVLNITSHSTTPGRPSDPHLDVPKPELANFLSVDAKNSEGVDFYKAKVILLVKEKNYKVHICVRITSNTLSPTVGGFHTGVWPALVESRLFKLKSSGFIFPVLKMFLKSTLDSFVRAIGKVIMLVQLGVLIHTGPHWCFGQSHSTITRRNIIHRQICQRYISDGRQNCSYLFYSLSLVATISEYMPLLDQLHAFKTKSDIESDTNDQRDIKSDVFVTSCEICSNSAECSISVQVTTSTAGAVHMVPRLNKMGSRIVLQVSRIINALTGVLMPIRFASATKKLTTFPKEKIIGVGINLPDFIVHLDQAAVISSTTRREVGG